MRYCGHFLIKVEGGAKNYKRDLPLPLAWLSFTVQSCSERLTHIYVYTYRVFHLTKTKSVLLASLARQSFDIAENHT